MEEKKVKIEVSRLAFIFIVLFSLSLLVWSFVIGVWIGTKIAGKTKEEIALEPSPPVVENVTIPQVAKENATLPPPSETNATVSQPSVEKVPPTEQPSVKKETIPESVPTQEKKIPEYKRKEVAKLSTEIKKMPISFFTLQIGAFSQKEKAEKMKSLAETKGYEAFIKEVKINGTPLYKIYVGKYSTRAEAEKQIPQVSKNLGITNPFIVELK